MMKRGFPSIPLGALLAAAAMLAGLCASAHAQASATPAATPQGTPAQTPVTFNPEDDPNAPGLSRAERIRRQETYIRKKLATQREQKMVENKKALEDKAAEDKANPPERPNNPPPTEPGGAMPPTNPALPLSKAGEQKPTEWAYKLSGEPRKLLDADPWGFKKLALYVHPASVVATAGETFSTTCKLLNMDKTAPNRVDLVVRYPRENVAVVSLHQDFIGPFLAGKPEWGVDAERGELRYSASLNRPLDGIDTPILEIRWKALKPAENVSIELKHGARFSRVMKDGESLTENEFGPAGVLAGTSVRILEPRPPVPRGDRLVVEGRPDEFAPALAPLGSLDDAPPVLWLDYERRDQYEPGQWIVADVVLENPAAVPFDDLRFVLAFDPEALEVADTDERNLIRTGINILDGPFRDWWRWDRLGENRVEPASGRIAYRMGRSDFRRQPSGIVARLFLRVKRPVAEPLLDWIVEGGPESADAATGVWLMGENLLERRERTGMPAEMILVGAGANGAPDTGAGGRADPELYREPRR